jgi:hypothetical protein
MYSDKSSQSQTASLWGFDTPSQLHATRYLLLESICCQTWQGQSNQTEAHHTQYSNLNKAALNSYIT